MEQGERAAIFTYSGHDDLTYPAGHPFRPERAGMFMEILGKEGLLDEPWLDLVQAEPASWEEMGRFHERAYLEALERVGRGEFDVEMLGCGLGSEDCPAFRGLFDLARLSAGASLQGARRLARGEARFAFNPIGGFHHSGPANAEGFCYVNDVVLACGELAEAGRRVACLDLDVHHGNGTESAFLSDPRVLTVSTHQGEGTLYPWSGEVEVLGEGPGLGYNANVPLPPGADDAAFARAFSGVVDPLLAAWKPDIVVLEIGMDVLARDPLANLRMTNNGIADAVGRIRDLGAPVLALGGGGYSPADTARGWALAWSVLCGEEAHDEFAGLVGGVFLGSSERAGGMRDMRAFASGPEREALDAEVDRVIAFHREHLFPIHGIG